MYRQTKVNSKRAEEKQIQIGQSNPDNLYKCCAHLNIIESIASAKYLLIFNFMEQHVLISDFPAFRCR